MAIGDPYTWWMARAAAWDEKAAGEPTFRLLEGTTCAEMADWCRKNAEQVKINTVTKMINEAARGR